MGVGELAMRGREHAVVIRPGSCGLVLHTLFYAGEVRIEDEFPADLGLVEAPVAPKPHRAPGPHKSSRALYPAIPVTEIAESVRHC
jgi:hypothetical protein